MVVQFWFRLGPVTRTQAEVCETGSEKLAGAFAMIRYHAT